MNVCFFLFLFLILNGEIKKNDSACFKQTVAYRLLEEKNKKNKGFNVGVRV